MRLTVQVKLQPMPEQSNALLRTLETANQACNRLSQIAWETKQFGQFKLQQLGYHETRRTFPLSAQMVVRLTAKVADAYKLDHKRPRAFLSHDAIAYDLRILSWNMAASKVSIWSLDGRLSIPFVYGDRQRERLDFQRGETDLVYRAQRTRLHSLAGDEVLSLQGDRMEPSYKLPALAGAS